MSMSVRKYTSKKIIVLKSEEIRMIEDEWNDRFNRNYYKLNTNLVG
mgnify:CR=1 FL=1